MKVSELNSQDLELITNSSDAEINGAIICDLLSWVMGKGEVGQVWLTIQAHLNVVAIASLKELSAVIICEGVEVSEEVKQKAIQQDVTIFTSKLSSYQIAGYLHSLGI